MPRGRRIRRWWQSKPGRVKLSLLLLATSLAGWPISALTFAKSEPPTVLGLSWFAITITALDVVFTSQVHEKQDAAAEDDDDA